jgi:Tfp pilus assembly protein PilN
MVDLIPAEYRRQLQVKRLLRGFAWSFLALLLAFGVSYTTLARALKGERATIVRDRQLQAQISARQLRLAELKSQEDAIAKRLRDLTALRGEAPIRPLFDAIDSALSARVWFSEFEYARDDEPAKVASAAVARGGHAEIGGVAANHAALAEFVTLLGGRPDIVEVRLRDSSTRSYPTFQVVEFHLSAQIGGTPGKAQ